MLIIYKCFVSTTKDKFINKYNISITKMPKIKYKEEKNKIEYDTIIIDYNEKTSKSKVSVPFPWVKKHKAKKVKVTVELVENE